ncbi:phytanoyl-CoA dioxygenase family protein [Paraburkholderia domus]|jgi:Protein involved in biosynthesis of mitomycin antibiotics/polyketide fumonisin|uniref:phytanoyl-CoA dioxygenase family protein n=1 Tax=Paraburkholderia domus TaxID=2793075 RepID=UPI0019116BE0|nr:phytanoyl-CoA dioxygenase family protein [Paraburkholderia domus]MBK5066197.1 phytanoyl-CoA dioxygenase family protein [Burkholderia sp. R-70199]CAE6968485.1 hypothetical protein R70199_07947 [Paraburkholderia domus]
MPLPPEFTPEVICERSPREERLYTNFLEDDRMGESLFASNPWLEPPSYDKPLEWNTGKYWETTVARKHDYWRSIPLPQPTKDIRQMRHDLRSWGYCLIEDGMSEEQCFVLNERLVEQAAAEHRAGVALGSPFGQYVNTLVNKGDCFARCIEQDPEVVQAGPLIEQLANETLGDGWICYSFFAVSADPDCYPQRIHMDQGGLMPWLPPEAPVLLNTLYVLQDVDEHNGGTLIIPGSHRAMAMAGTGGTIGVLPPTINLEARAGTIMVFDGRLLHATGVNRTAKQRFVAIMAFTKPWLRQQENWVLSVRPEVLASASPKLLHRMGFQAVFNGGTVEGFGLNYVKGYVGDPMAVIKQFRLAIDAGEYKRVGVLGPNTSAAEMAVDFTLRSVMSAAKTAMGDAWMK